MPEGAGPPAGKRFDEDAPTQVDDVVPAPPRASAPAPRPSSAPDTISTTDSAPPVSTLEGSRGGASSASSLVTARETLGLQEIHQTRAFLRVAIVICIAQALALAGLGGDPLARRVLLAALALSVVTSAITLRVFRRDETYTVGRSLPAAFTTILAVYCTIFYFGPFSPAPVVVPLGVYFFCTGQSDRANLAVYGTCAVAYAALATLVATRVIADRGVVSVAGLALTDRVVMIVLVEVVLLAVFVVARNMRRTTLYAIERHDVVVRSLAQRDALLHEARHDLVQAMRVGGVGRYSGEVIGSFRLGSLIGRGAMGEVYDAVRLDTKQPAAVKLVHPQLLAERDVVERFLREARLTSALSVPNVVRVVEASAPDAPIPYLAMERLRGEDFATTLRLHKRVPMHRLLGMLRQVGMGLDAAHAAGIVHRDLKPRNLFCARTKGEELWKILDFGVSKLEGGEGTLTKGQIVGTPAYMAPEQARALVVGPRADIFALGVIAYRALTGAPPFSSDTSVEILFRVSHAMPVRPSDLARVPSDVDDVLAIALAKDPADRFSSAAELVEALDAASRGRLDTAWKERAERLVAALPWGASGLIEPER